MLQNAKYITYQDSEQNQARVLWWSGMASHSEVWKVHKGFDPFRYHRALSAGNALFNGKKKTFIVTGDSPDLNLVPHEDDHKLLVQDLLVNKELEARLFYAPGSKSPNLLLLNKYSSCEQHDRVLDVRYMAHDSKEPFRTNIEISVFRPDYLALLLDYMLYTPVEKKEKTEA